MENLAMIPDTAFWHGRRVLITGHTGFKGGWLAYWLTQMGAEVTGISLPPATQPNLFESLRLAELVSSHFCDIRNPVELSSLVRNCAPEIIFHLAAQPLVRTSYRQPIATFSTNVMGTAHILEAMRGQPSVRVGIVITTDKVYRNAETIFPYRENDSLGGHDPYSASKAAAELIVASYRASFLAEQGVAIATARAGNVIGGGDWSEDRLIPDAVRAWSSGQNLEIRRPDAIRPWQHVLEPLAGYLRLAELLWQKPSLAGPFNFGPPTDQAASVRQVVEIARTAFGTGSIAFGDGTEGPHEAGLLTLEIAKARAALAFKPRWNLAEAVQRTMNWYRAWNTSTDARYLCESDIAAFKVDQ